MKKIIYVKGMHCISCELILEKGLKKISGADLIMVNHKKGILEIDFDKESSYDKVVKLIEESGFNVVEERDKNINNIFGNIIAILIVVILFMVTQIFDLYSFLPDTSTLSYGSAFLVGIIASVSTCLAITGGIIIGFSRYVDKAHGLKGHIKIQLGFQIGRILGFFLLGGILGYVGEVFSLSLSLTGIITFVVGFLLLYMGLNILKIVPSITKFGIHMPKSFAHKIEALGKPKYAPIVGALTFFLPCGFTQTMQLLAVSSGNFWSGGLVMMIFALGTAPVLFSVGLGSSYFKEKKFNFLNKIIGVIVIFFGIFTISNAYNLLNFSGISTITNNLEQTETIKLESNENIELKVIEVGHNGWSTDPEIIELKVGGNYKIIITPTSDGKGCMSTQVIPTLSKKTSYVKKGVPIEYKIYNAKIGTHNIVCTSMGMKQGKIIIR
ncbi:MAG: sulfite exporter TauE/SafE family protein [Candidatus Gracilibacteria bacterium]